MCASNLNTNLNSRSKKHPQEQFLINDRSEEKSNSTKKKMCISNKRITRSQNRSTITSQDNLLNKSNKKFLKKECCLRIISKSVISCRFCKRSFETVKDCQTHVCTIKSQSLSNESVKFMCSLCMIQFKTKNLLDKHLKGHNHDKCNHCYAQCAIHKELCKHFKNVDNIIDPEKFSTCALCKKYFCEKISLDSRRKIHAREKTACNQCSLLFEDEIAYTQHIKVHLNYKCQVCNKLFQDNQHMIAHKKHVCELCNITYTTDKLLKKHKQNIHNLKIAKKHQCEICDKRFNRPLHLTIHKRVHTGEKPLKCLDCGKNYYSNKTFAKHLKTVRHLKKVSINNEVIVEKKYTCEKCEAKFFELQSLQRHVQTLHSIKEPLKCDHCTYRTKCQANLKRHLEVHSQTKRFACEMCGLTFRNFRSLKDHHAFIHSDKRDFICNVCNKSFKVNGDLQRHKKVHSNDRPYKCSCTCSFKRLSHLKRHMLSCQHVGMFDKCAQTEELNRIISEVDPEFCDDAIQLTDVNKKITETLLKEISSTDTFAPKGESILTLNDLLLCSNDKISQTTVLHSLDETAEIPMVTVTNTIKNIPISQLPNTFENPIVTLADQISAENLSLSQSVVNWACDTPSQTTTIPLMTSMVTPPIMAVTNSKPSESTSSTILATSVEQPLLNFAENNISLLTAPSVIEPAINFIDNQVLSNNTSRIELSVGHPAINNNLPIKVATNIVEEIALVSNERTQHCKSQALLHNFFESRSTSPDNNISSNIDSSNLLNTTNIIQPPVLQLQNISSITVPKSTVKEYHNPIPSYSFLTQNFDLGDKLTVNDNDLIYSIPKSKNLASTELSNTEESYPSDLFGQANVIIPFPFNTFCFSDSSPHPVNVSLNTNSADRTLNQQLPLLNLVNVVGSLNNSVENSVPNYPVTVNNLVFPNDTVFNSILNVPIYNTGFKSPS